MPWIYRFDDRALKELARLDRQIQKEIIAYFDARVAGPLAGLWRYRVRDYRIVCQIKGRELLVLVLMVGHRKEVYR